MNNEDFFLLSECHDARINGQPPPKSMQSIIVFGHS